MKRWFSSFKKLTVLTNLTKLTKREKIKINIRDENDITAHTDEIHRIMRTCFRNAFLYVYNLSKLKIEIDP